MRLPARSCCIAGTHVATFATLACSIRPRSYDLPYSCTTAPDSAASLHALPRRRLWAWPVVRRLERPIASPRIVRQSPAPVIPLVHQFLTQSEVVDFVR